MPGDIVIAGRRSRPILLGLALVLGAVAASALLSRLAVRIVHRDTPYPGWVAQGLNGRDRSSSAPNPTLH
ncbi:hypothetical protein [Phenylobacterium sp.]|uniref:hypothetical protein n=1 Tax=Phenylobacterium sp. TaxID=1871053 RepID=UPI0030F3A2CF